MIRARRRHRTASVYMMVLGTSVIASAVALFSLLSLRTQSIGKDMTRDRIQAELFARGMVEQAKLKMKSDSNWRTSQPIGVWWNLTGSGATAQVEVQDPDGSLSDDPMDAATITGTATFGRARQKVSVTMAPFVEPLPAITSPVHANFALTVNLGGTLTVTSGPAFCNGVVTNLGSIVGDVTTNGYLGSNNSGIRTQPTPTRAVPDANVMSSFEAQAQAVAFSGNWDKRVLGPGVNFAGTTQTDGVYVVNTGGSSFEIRDCRIVGTLIVRCGSSNKVVLRDRVLMQPARPDYPVLITDGTVEFDLKSASENLSESGALTNFNPTGAGYNFVVDSDTGDVYPNEVQGLVHAKGNAILAEESRVIGAVVSEGSVFVSNSPVVHFNPSLRTNPPVGYRLFTMRVQPNGWRRVVD